MVLSKPIRLTLRARRRAILISQIPDGEITLALYSGIASRISLDPKRIYFCILGDMKRSSIIRENIYQPAYF